MVSMVDATGTSTFTYDTLGRVLTATAPGGTNTETYTYDKLGNRATMKINGTDTQTYTYDGLNRLDSLSSIAGNFDWIYSGTKPGLLAELDLPNGTKTTYGYETTFNRLTSITSRKSDNSLISQYAYGYDTVAKREGRQYADKTMGAGTTQRTNYVYDSVDQIGSEISNEATPLLKQTYGYDAMGNRTVTTQAGGTAVAGGSTNAYTSNALNQITSLTLSTNTAGTVTSKTQTYDYDTRGNLTQTKTAPAAPTDEYPQYTYDDANRVTQVLWILSDPA